MSDRPETNPNADSPLAVTDFERERLEWQRRLYAAEDLAARLLREKNQAEQAFRQQIAQLESDVTALREKLEQVSNRPGPRPRSTKGSSRGAAEPHDDPFGHVIRQASKGKHARVRRQARKHVVFLLLIILTLVLAAVLVWQGYRTRAFWQSSSAGERDAPAQR